MVGGTNQGPETLMPTPTPAVTITIGVCHWPHKIRSGATIAVGVLENIPLGLQIIITGKEGTTPTVSVIPYILLRG